MKKGLFLLPLLGGLVLAGCEFTVFGKTFKFGESSQKQTSNTTNNTSNNTNNNTNNNNNNNNTNGGGKITSGLALVNMKALADVVDKDADPVVFANGGCTVSISQGSSSSSLSDAVTNSAKYEFRIFKNFEVTLAADTEFSTLEVIYSTRSSGAYCFNWSPEGSTNEYDDSYDTGAQLGKAVLTLDAPTKEYTFTASEHQIRVASIEFKA